MRSEILSMTAIQGSAGRVSRGRAVRSFDGSALGLPAGYGSGNSGQSYWGGFLGCQVMQFSQHALLGVC